MLPVNRCNLVEARTVPVTVSQLCIDGKETSELLAVFPPVIRGFSWQRDAGLNRRPHTAFHGPLCTPGSVLCSINLDGNGNGVLRPA